MYTPAAKRRRVDAANATLKKPFHSPVIRRPDAHQAGQQGTPGPRQTSIEAITTSAQDGNYSPSSPSAPARPPPPPSTIRPARSLGALRQTPKRPSSPLFRTPLHTSAGDRAVGGVLKRLRSTAEIAASDHDGKDRPGGAFLELVRAHRHTVQDAAVKDLNRKLETVRQARRIEDASERARPGEEVDQELRDLIVKWKGASRTAADELFDSVKERVDNAGGPQAWNKMRERQLAFYQGFDQDLPSKRKRSEEGDLEAEIEGDSENETEKYALQDESAKDDGNEEEGRELEFNMAQMLQSLNVDLGLLGYNEAEERWVD